jgi:hypothetical protein
MKSNKAGRKKKYGEPTMVKTFRYPVSKDVEVKYFFKKLLDKWKTK